MSEIIQFGESTSHAMPNYPKADFSGINMNTAKFSFGSEGYSDTLEALRVANAQSIAGFGLDNAYMGISLFLAAHNVIMMEMLGDLCAITSDIQRAYGSINSNNMFMEELDADGKVAAQKTTAGETVGFPLRRYGIGMSWNYTYFQNKTPADLAAQVQSMATADFRNIQYQIKSALFGNLKYPGARGTSNYDFIDRLGNGVHLGVKKIVNADGAGLPPGPNGEVFDGTTHNHFMVSSTYWPTSNAVSASGVASVATATTLSTDLNALIRNLREHNGGEGQAVVFININNENDVRNATGFIPLIYSSTIPNVVTDIARGALDANNQGNRQIGFFSGAEVWVKPWIPQDYLLSFFRTGAEAPLVARIPTDWMPGKTAGGDLSSPAPGDLRIVQESADHPLYAMAIERQIGFGAWNRWNAVVMFVGNYSGNSATVYTPPTL